MENHVFKNRSEAGKELGGKLLPSAKHKPLVLVLPRGGVPVGFEIAQALHAPLDTIVVRKIGAPGNPEFGVGAIAPGGVVIIDEKSLQGLGISRRDLDPIIGRETKELERREKEYHSGSYSSAMATDTVIVVDDGVATGVTARAAIKSVLVTHKTRKPLTVIFAVPVCARDTADELRKQVEVVCPREVDHLGAISSWYEHFEQVSDEEVIALLQAANHPPST